MRSSPSALAQGSMILYQFPRVPTLLIIHSSSEPPSLTFHCCQVASSSSSWRRT